MCRRGSPAPPRPYGSRAANRPPARSGHRNGGPYGWCAGRPSAWLRCLRRRPWRRPGRRAGGQGRSPAPSFRHKDRLATRPARPDPYRRMDDRGHSLPGDRRPRPARPRSRGLCRSRGIGRRPRRRPARGCPRPRTGPPPSGRWRARPRRGHGGSGSWPGNMFGRKRPGKRPCPREPASVVVAPRGIIA